MYLDSYLNMRNQLFLFLLIVLSFSAQAQKEIAYPEAFEVFDYYVGHTNSGIFDGVEYYEKYPVRNNKHKFFDSPNFQLGALVYGNEAYFQVPLKYDVYDDVLLARNPATQPANITALDTDKISSFTIGNFNFIRISKSTDKGEELTGFFEVLFDHSDVVLMKKHRKKMFKKTENGVFYEFKDNPWYLIANKDVFLRLKNENSLIEVFPESREFIKEYIRSKRSLKEENYDQYIVSLFNELKN